jgi:hypothetical protein
LFKQARAARRSSRRTLRDDDYDEWLEIEIQTRASFSLATEMKSSAIRGIVNLSRRRKMMAIALFCSLILISAWMNWDSQRSGLTSLHVYNDDLNVFDISFFDPETNTSYIKGKHDLLMDVRTCRIIGAFVEFVPERDGPPTLAASWNLTYGIQIGVFGRVSIVIEYWLFDDGFNSLDSGLAFSIAIDRSINTNSTIGFATASLQYRFYRNYSYHLAVAMVVELFGDSSISGIDADVPASLYAWNLTASNVD